MPGHIFYTMLQDAEPVTLGSATDFAVMPTDQPTPGKSADIPSRPDLLIVAQSAFAVATGSIFVDEDICAASPGVIVTVDVPELVDVFAELPVIVYSVSLMLNLYPARASFATVLPDP